ncbi:MAG: putative deacylase, partial [Paenibacillus sp.]|nr:putative deacylase [Paenibacillus sp.]
MAVRMEIEHYDAKAAVPGTKRSMTLMADIGLEQPLELPVLRIDGAAAGPALLVLAGVHGDEYEGVETILRLYRDLRPEQLAGTIILVPQANALSYRGGTRISPEDGVNMARAFPGNPEGTPTERIAWHLHHRFIAHADFMLDLHSGGTHYAVSTLVGYYHN